jgi:hypothetical protein
VGDEAGAARADRGRIGDVYALRRHDPSRPLRSSSGAASRVYLECIGLTPAETGDGYRELRANGLVLWLVRGRQSPGADTDRDGSVRMRSEVSVKLAFEVGSIERVAASIEASGAMAQTSRNFAGYRRSDAVDPEGQHRRTRQSARSEALTTPCSMFLAPRRKRRRGDPERRFRDPLSRTYVASPSLPRCRPRSGAVTA